MITGASSGIGLSTARAFAAAGSKIVVVARRKKILEELSDQIKNAGGYAIAISADITDKTSIKTLFQSIEKELGRLDVLVNNAGIGLNSPVITMNSNDFERVLATNLFGPIFLIQAALPLMITQRKGIIVNILSISGRRAMPNSGGYCASKAALELLSDSLRMELFASGIKVVNIFPGFTSTLFSSNALGAKTRGRGRRFSVTPDRVARTIVKSTRLEKRESYVTILDRLGVSCARLFPSLVDRIMQRLWGSSFPNLKH